MSCFRCEKCGCVENTATSGYWSREDGKDKRALCSECDPAIGKWHGRFPKRSAKGLVLASDGFLYSKDDVASDGFKWRMEHQGLKVAGVVAE